MSVTWLKISSISLSEKPRHKSPLGRFGIWLNWLKSTCISASYLQSSSRSEDSEGLHEEIHGMEDVELHSESCDFLLCCLRQAPAHWIYTAAWKHMKTNALLGADVCLYRIAFALFTEFTACLHLHIGTSDWQRAEMLTLCTDCIRVLRVPCPALSPASATAWATTVSRPFRSTSKALLASTTNGKNGTIIYQ